MQHNVLINSIDIAYQQNEENQLLLLVEIVDNPNLPNIKVLGAVMDNRLVGYLITELLRVLQVPTLNHVSNVPAILELNEQQWTLKNFINEKKQDIFYICFDCCRLLLCNFKCIQSRHNKFQND